MATTRNAGSPEPGRDASAPVGATPPTPHPDASGTSPADGSCSRPADTTTPCSPSRSSPDRRHVATGGYDGLVRVWDVASGRLVATLRVTRDRSSQRSTARTLVSSPRREPTPPRLVWDARRGAPLLVLQGHHAGIRGCSSPPTVAPDRRRGRNGPCLGRVTRRRPRLAHALEPHELPRRPGVHTRRQGVAGDRSRELDAEQTDLQVDRLERPYGPGRVVHLLTTDGGLPSGFNSEGTIHTYVPTATSPDGSVAARTKTSATGAATGTVEVSDAASQRVLATLVRRPPVGAIAFAAKERLVVTGYVDGVARVWDVSTGRPLHLRGAQRCRPERRVQPRRHAARRRGRHDRQALGSPNRQAAAHVARAQPRRDVARLQPRRTRLATGAPDGIVRVYVLPIDELMAISRARLTRGWTAAECALPARWSVSERAVGGGQSTWRTALPPMRRSTARSALRPGRADLSSSTWASRRPSAMSPRRRERSDAAPPCALSSSNRFRV